jgi:2-C-methyl-D-erythritol 4-phosphate cytidylyltransferase / 2-C-methyl-D-erythritol 2,4-cyclodiphosphate synthase
LRIKAGLGHKAEDQLRIAAVVTAAGSSSRFGGGKKELLPIGGRSILDRAIAPFLELPKLEALVVTAPQGREAELRDALSPASVEALERLGPGRFAIIPGGASRRDSVRLGLEALVATLCGGEADSSRAIADDIIVLVHDGARPWASAELAAKVAAAAALRGAALPVLPLVDTPKELGPEGTVIRHPPRSSVGGAQTPQGFRLRSLLAAHRKAASEGLECTDDAELWARYVGPVAAVPGELENRKVTFARDVELPQDHPAFPFRIGQGWDLHRLVPGRRLMLGGIEIPSEFGEEAHSDGDVLLHAAIDALLGAAALGDIGTHFPPSDEKWRGADSRELARRAAAIVREAGWEIGNLDCTVVLEAPKLVPFKEAMRASVAASLGIGPGAVSVKAKTKEGVDAAGEGRAVEASVSVLIFPRPAGPAAPRPAEPRQ